MKINKISILIIVALNLNSAGFSPEQMQDIQTMMMQTQELAQTQNTMGENILNTKQDNITAHTQDNFKINPLGLYPQNQIEQAPRMQSNYYQGNTGNYGEISKEEIQLMQSAMKNQDLQAIQKKFFKDYTGYENTKKIEYEPNKTQKILTRNAMATTLIFSSPIDNFILGDTTGFNAQQIDGKNAIVVKPNLIGIDTSLTVFTTDNKIHTFYIYSTNYKSKNDPSFVLYINDKESIEKQKQKQETQKKEYLTIKDGIAELKIKKNDINREFIQIAKEENEWLKAQEIFSDKRFTYFKYDKNKMPQLPTIFAVIDNQDSPVETRTIGNWLIAETISPKFTIKSGNSYVCVRKPNQETQKKAQKEFFKTDIQKQNEAIKVLKGEQ